MFQEIWKGLPSEFRASFLKRCLEWLLESPHGELPAIAVLVAKCMHSREKTALAQLRKGDISGLRLAISRYPDRMAVHLGMAVFGVQPPEMLEVHRVLGTELSPETGKPVDDYASKAPGLADMKRLLDGSLPPHLVDFSRLVVGIVSSAGSGAWKPVARRAIEEWAEESMSRGAAAVVSPVADAAGLPGAMPELHPPLPDVRPEVEAAAAIAGPAASTPQVRTGPTELDRILIDAAVQAANSAVGSRTLEGISRVAEELVRLNDRRFPSHALLGFVDALQGKPARTVTAGGNVPRRIWYLKGFLEGHRRTDTDAGFVARVKALDPADTEMFEIAMRDFRQQTDIAILSVTDLVIRAAIAEDDPDLVLSWFSGEVAATAMEQIIDWALTRIRSGDPRGPLPLLRRMRTRIRPLQVASQFDDDEERRRRYLLFVSTVTGLEATALRLSHRFPDAVNRLEWLLDAVGPEEFGPELYGALALARLKIGKVEEITLKGPELESILGRIRMAEADLHRGESGSLHAPSLFLLALPTVFDRNAGRSERAVALKRLRQASEILSTMETDLAQGDFPRMVEAVAAILELREGDFTTGPAAAATLLRELERGLSLAPALLRESAEYAIALGAPEAIAIFRHSFAAGATLDDSLPVEEFVQKNPATGEALLDHAEGRSMTTFERSRLVIRILRGLAGNPEPAIALRARCADALEVYADRDPGSRRLLIEFLEPADREERVWNLVWESQERDAILVRCHLQGGNLDRVGALLHEIGFQALRSTSSRRALAVDCSEQLDQFQLPNSLAAVIEPPQAAPAASAKVDRPRIALVGGNEVQGQYESRLLEWFRSRWPDGRLRVVRTGWGANWGSEIEEIDRNLASFHAVVILTFVRTNLGRHLRKRVNEVGIQWFACTGHGYESLRRSIEHAVIETEPRRMHAGT